MWLCGGFRWLEPDFCFLLSAFCFGFYVRCWMLDVGCWMFSDALSAFSRFEVRGSGFDVGFSRTRSMVDVGCSPGASPAEPRRSLAGHSP